MARSKLKTDAYTALVAAVDVARKTHDELKLMSYKDVEKLLGESAAGLSKTFVVNMQRKLVRSMVQEGLQSAADWILSRISGTYPNAAVGVKRGRIVQVWLDGKPEEVE